MASTSSTCVTSCAATSCTDFRVPALISASALAVSMIQSLWVGRCRGTYNIPAPKTTGNEEFEKAYRSHQNMSEALIVFIPSLFLFHRYVSTKYAAIFGWLFVISRIAYHFGYISSKPMSREYGFFGGFVAQSVFVVGTIGTLARCLNDCKK